MKQPKKVVAIQYVAGEVAPNVIAKGKGVIADKLLEKATKVNLPIYKNEKLVEELGKIDVGEYIPEELYAVVAEVLVFVTDLDKLRDEKI